MPSAHGESASSLFARASRVFDGWTDCETGVRVLRIRTRREDPEGCVWSTQYHQFRCFVDGGREVLLSRGAPAPGGGGMTYVLLDLTSGETRSPFPPGMIVNSISGDGRLACLQDKAPGRGRAVVWDVVEEREVASAQFEGWSLNCVDLLDERRAMAFFWRGRPYRELVHSRHYLLCPDEPPRLVLDAEGYFCSHVQPCPTEPDIYSYDRWPSPARYVDQVLHVRSLDGRWDEPVPLTPDAIRPAVMWGARDHYVWTPDGKRIVSYLCPEPFDMGPGFDHYKLRWWLSVTDWRTGEDLAAAYPEGRWGGHMQVSPDSRYIVCGGAPGFDRLFAVAFPYPFVLPDGSGVIFNAGWPGTEHGVYLAEWPAELR